jgi:HSP20 family protein
MQQDQSANAGQSVPVNVYRTPDRVVIAAPMPGLQPQDLRVEVTSQGRLVLQGRHHSQLRQEYFDVWVVDMRYGPGAADREPYEPPLHWEESKDVLLREWRTDGYYRAVDLPVPVDAISGTVTYGNGVLVVALPITNELRPAFISLEPVGWGHGQHVGSTGHPPEFLGGRTSTEHMPWQPA